MQPYFVPYIGYFQLLAAVDTFVIYDDIQYTKRGWVNRNRVLGGGCNPVAFSLPLASGPSTADIRERSVADSFSPGKLLNLLRGSYEGAHHWEECHQLAERILSFEDPNLFHFLRNSILEIGRALRIDTPIVVSSSLNRPERLSGQDRVIDLVSAVGGRVYVNPPGGRDLYDANGFEDVGIALAFIEPALRPYAQGACEYTPALSILDSIAWLGCEEVGRRVAEDFSIDVVGSSKWP